MSTPDSPLAATFVPAPDHWPRLGAPIRAVVCHMAEGAGTVTWLTRNDGNSSHYVVELSGRIVQMVPESLAAGSLNPTLTRTTNDSPYTFELERVVYGITVLRTSLGSGGVADPNRVVIAIETEGFAKPLTADQTLRFPKANPAGGPNAAQRKALKALVNDIRRRNGALPAIGHRDQQSYKSCPGHAFPWADYGGHGVKAAYVAPPAPVPEVDTVNSYPVPTVPSVVLIPAGTWLYATSALLPDAANIQVDPGRMLPYLGAPSSTYRVVEYVNSAGVHSGKAMFVKASEATDIRAVTDASPFTQVQVNGAYNAALVAAQAAVSAIPRR